MAINPLVRKRFHAMGGQAAPDLPEQVPLPLGDFLLVRLPPMETKTAGGIIIPENEADKRRHIFTAGEVVAMGHECYSDKEKYPTPWVTVGDQIMFAKYNGTRFMVDGREYRLMLQDEVQALCPDPFAVKQAN